MKNNSKVKWKYKSDEMFLEEFLKKSCYCLYYINIIIQSLDILLLAFVWISKGETDVERKLNNGI